MRRSIKSHTPLHTAPIKINSLLNEVINELFNIRMSSKTTSMWAKTPPYCEWTLHWRIRLNHTIWTCVHARTSHMRFKHCDTNISTLSANLINFFCIYSWYSLCFFYWNYAWGCLKLTCYLVIIDRLHNELYGSRWTWEDLYWFLLFANFSSRRASAQAVTSKWELRTTSPMNTNSSAGENCFFGKKTGRSRAVYESIRKIPTGKTKQILVASQPSIRFFPLMARNGPFRPFFGP